MLVLDEGWEAYPELVEDVVWAPSLKESQMFTFVTMASSNKGLNLHQVCYESQDHTWCITCSLFITCIVKQGLILVIMVLTISLLRFSYFILLCSGVG